MRIIAASALTALTLFTTRPASAQSAPKVLVLVVAHGDDETPAGPGARGRA